MVMDGNLRLLLLSLDDYTAVYSVGAGSQVANGAWCCANITVLAP